MDHKNREFLNLNKEGRLQTREKGKEGKHQNVVPENNAAYFEWMFLMEPAPKIH
jgi:hypothetical protein